MRIITWNCCRKFREKHKHLLPYNPDLLIIPECECEEKQTTKFYDQMLWIGDNQSKGLGVFSFNDFKIERYESYCDDFKYVLPIKVTTPENNDINLIAIWSQNNNEEPERRYIGEIWNALNYYKKLLKVPTMIAGDFNWNVRWDWEPDGPLAGNFGNVASLLKRHGIYSAYHECTHVKYGCEPDPTLYHNYNEKKPYHVDYVFASVSLLKDINSVGVGKYGKWRNKPCNSDHMPLMVKFEGIN
jgi:exodeoxyribonuclease-3